jgi:hypothetical protein
VARDNRHVALRQLSGAQRLQARDVLAMPHGAPMKAVIQHEPQREHRIVLTPESDEDELQLAALYADAGVSPRDLWVTMSCNDNQVTVRLRYPRGSREAGLWELHVRGS